MAREEELHEAMLALYQTTGEAVGYWGRRYKQSVLRNGGLETAKRMLKRRRGTQRGLEALFEANRPDLTLESLVLEPRFAGLFTSEELSEARKRLAAYMKESGERAKEREQLYPDDLQPGVMYPEGAKRTVRVNAFERNRAARAACLKHHGYRCAVCSMSFDEVYGPLGAGFIHVHHLLPVSRVGENYKVDPRKDMIPVCPNCHAMLHWKHEEMRTPDELRRLVRTQR